MYNMLLMFNTKVKVKSLSRVRLFATLWTVAYKAPPSMGFSRQECWSGLPFTIFKDYTHCYYKILAMFPMLYNISL